MLLTDRTPVEWMRGRGDLLGVRSRAVEENPTSTECTPSIRLWGKCTSWCWRSSPAHSQHSPCPWGDAGEPGLILDFHFDLYKRQKIECMAPQCSMLGPLSLLSVLLSWRLSSLMSLTAICTEDTWIYTPSQDPSHELCIVYPASSLMSPLGYQISILNLTCRKKNPWHSLLNLLLH